MTIAGSKNCTFASLTPILQSTVSIVGTLFNEDQAKARGLTSASTISGTYGDRYSIVTHGINPNEPSEVYVSRTNAVTSIIAPTFTVYLQPGAVGDEARNRAWMFHEGLHGFLSDKLGRTDADIQRAFGIDEGDSSNITEFIKKHCFN
jgi:hypothetical protein